MNRTTLKYELDLDFVLIAITSPLKDYRLCFKINKELQIDLNRLDDLELILHAGSQPGYFSRYWFTDPHNEIEFNLLANKGTEGFLIPEMKKVDFFLLIRNYIDSDELKALIAGLNRIPEVLVAAEVDPRKLKSKENLII
ncbi:IPExxxVDY family protein [Flavihumibacter sp. R14]|nr:IPExxxVDY family protein [Flavihumibacter soli]